jgi:hypothetical protein
MVRECVQSFHEKLRLAKPASVESLGGFSVQRLLERAGPTCSLQLQPAMLQAQLVAQVQTGLQSQLQFWQVQEELDESVDSVGFVFFMGDLVSSL